MSDSTTTTIDWKDWLRRWDAQQSFSLPSREERFDSMLDALEATVGTQADRGVVALDLACGPGAISQRLLTRFPAARTFAVDLDPVLLAIGQGVLGTLEGRLTWLQEDLNDPLWMDRLVEQLGGRPLDAVLSSTALHWLAPGTLARIYRELGQLLRPGGIFLNADHMGYASDRPTIRDLATGMKERRRAAARAASNAEDWDRWWQAIEAEPALRDLVLEREKRFAWRDRKWVNAGFDFQVGALRDAGFREVDVIWQRLDNRVLMAVR